MRLLKSNRLSELRNWKTLRLGLVSRYEFRDVVKCDVTGLSFGNVAGVFTLPTVDFQRGQTLYLEMKPGSEITIAGKSLRVEIGEDQHSLTIEDGVQTQSFPIPKTDFFTFELNGSTIKSWHTGLVGTANTFRPTTYNVEFGIGPLQCKNVLLAEVCDSETIDSDNRMPIPPLKTSVYSMFEHKHLKYSSGQSPSTGTFGNVKVVDAPSAFLTAQVTLTWDMQTIRFSHLVGHSVTDFETGAADSSVEQIVIVAAHGYALVLSDNEVVGKFQYADNQVMTLQNVFNLRLYDTDVSSSAGMRMYVCGSADNCVDVLRYKVDNKYDYAAGRDDGKPYAALNRNSGLKFEVPDGVESFGVRIESAVAWPAERLRWTVDGVVFSLSFNAGLNLLQGSTMIFSEGFENVSASKFTVSVSGNRLYVIALSRVTEIKLPHTLEDIAEFELSNVAQVLKSVTSFASSRADVLFDSEVFGGSLEREGFVVGHDVGDLSVGKLSVELPEDAFEALPNKPVSKSEVVARLRTYFLEAFADHDEAGEVRDSEVKASLRTYYLEYVPDYDDDDIQDSEVTAGMQTYYLDYNPTAIPEEPDNAVDAYGRFYRVSTVPAERSTLNPEFTAYGRFYRITVYP